MRVLDYLDKEDYGMDTESVVIVLSKQEAKLLEKALLNAGVNTEPLPIDQDELVSALWTELFELGDN